jgi:transcriptional regulator with XRE-family HTH domain
MKLSTYLAENKLSPAQFAAKLNKPASTISRLIKGEREPGIVLLREISEATNGAVTPNDFLGGTAPIEHAGDAA